MDVPAMFAGIAQGISAMFGGPYHAAQVITFTETEYDAGGSIVSPGVEVRRDCQAQIDVATEAMRAEGYASGDVRFLILAATLSGTIDTDAKVEVLAGPHVGTWHVSQIERDPMGVYYAGRGRRA
ncbi:hypothetical protein [Sphingomonas montanisoli]|uniref:Uncharacterized protein n=1 Tax=Sphingomonas montanisoli TaxID=2606412 RepID=A0A5D9C4W1_9SPHN|nr:hypothetical protein [Sphingomonas montanisoli]TZG26513.1 hypothetical protein FYJ91_11180 [Sphingomonas montanisoli]